jgi:hypothetical protein
LAIPSEWTERVVPIAQEQPGGADEEQKTFISLPALFRQEDIPGVHGVILKPNMPAQANTPGGGKRVLLSPRIDQEIEIPEENIHQLPETLAGVLRICRGVYFIGDGAMFILDMEKIAGDSNDTYAHCG